MKEPHSQYFCREQAVLHVENFCFLENGPYSFSLAPAQTIGISGQSGVGKSQLLRAVSDLQPWMGVLRYGKYDCHSVEATSWRRTVCYIPAESAWWYDRVEDHFQNAAELSSDNLDVLHQLGFEPAVLGWQVSRLSSGEKQRLSIFRSLLNKPKVLLLDEPTSNLDQESIKKVEGVIIRFQQQTGAAILLVSHDHNQLRRLADIHYTIEKERMVMIVGHVKESG